MRRTRERTRALIAVAIVLSSRSLIQSAPPPTEVTIATWNLEWFFDEYAGDSYAKLAREQAAPNRAEWEWKRDGVAAAVAKLQPTILALQEVENQRVLFYLTTQLKKQYDLDYRIAFIQGTDYYTEQDVALLYRHGLVEYSRREQTDEMRASKEFYDVQKHLLAKFAWGEGVNRQTLTVLTAHFRAMPAGASIRQRQARLVRRWIEEELNRGENVVVLGDFNADETCAETPPNSEIGILRALDTPATNDDLIDLHCYLSDNSGDTHLLPGKQFDRILVSPSMMEDTPNLPDLTFRSMALRKDVVVRGEQPDKDHWNMYYQIPPAERDLSDHYPLIATFEVK